MARSKRAIVRHNRAQQAHQRAAPSRLVSEIARGTIARTKRPSARHHRAQAARSRGKAANDLARGCARWRARLPTLARQGSQLSRGKAAHARAARLRTLAREAAHARAARLRTLAREAAHPRAARLPTLAREAAHPRAARQPTLAREAAHFRVRHASPTREEGSANSCEGCSPASRARSARSRGRIRARARHAPGTRAANCLSSRGMQRAAASKANCRRSSEARQRALATKARSPRSSEARLARGMQPPLARQAAQAREASCPRSRGRPRSPWLGRVASFRAGSGHVPSGAATAVPWGPDAAISLLHARNHHGQRTSGRRALKA